MKKIPHILLLGVFFALFVSACAGATQTATPGSGSPGLTASPPSVLTETTETAATETTETLTTETATTSAGGTSETATPLANLTQTVGVPVTGGQLPQLVCQFCVNDVAHAILIMDENVTFELTSSTTSTNPTPTPSTTTGQTPACNSVETINGKQVVLCQGPTDTTITLNVCNGTDCTQFPVALQTCPLVALTETATPEAEASTATPTTGVVTDTATPSSGLPTSTPTP